VLLIAAKFDLQEAEIMIPVYHQRANCPLQGENMFLVKEAIGRVGACQTKKTPQGAQIDGMSDYLQQEHFQGNLLHLILQVLGKVG
jgi:CHASE1-domain containing sensor protein